MHPETKRARLVTIPSSMETQLCSNNFEDKFSGLHESLLGRVLNYLPTIDAVRTCVLSKTWRKAWTNVTELQFDDRMHRDQNDNRFTEFVDRVLRHTGSSHINSFYLYSFSSFDETLIISWLSNVLSRKLQKLVITLFKVGIVSWSPLFASFGSLVELRLSTWITLNVSAPALLPNLKYFSLAYATIGNVSLVSRNCFLKFPVLETFKASNCCFSGTDTVIIDSPVLGIFEMFNCSSADVPNGSGVCTIKILASKLEKIIFTQDRSEKILLSFPPSLPEAYLALSAQWPEKFLHNFSCVKSLALELGKDLNVSDIPIFKQLIYLHLIYDMTQHYKFRNFLNSAPILEVLNICDLRSSRSMHNSKSLEELRLKAAPECVRKMLKILHIRNFDAQKMQLSVLKYVMENAEVLGPVVLSLSNPITDKAKAEILSHPKASPHACVFFERSKVLTFCNTRVSL